MWVKTTAPWTVAQVLELNDRQRFQGHRIHPFTCEHCRDAIPGHEGELVATINGWICPTCDYTQDWAFFFESGDPSDP